MWAAVGAPTLSPFAHSGRGSGGRVPLPRHPRWKGASYLLPGHCHLAPALRPSDGFHLTLPCLPGGGGGTIPRLRKLLGLGVWGCPGSCVMGECVVTCLLGEGYVFGRYRCCVCVVSAQGVCVRDDLVFTGCLCVCPCISGGLGVCVHVGGVWGGPGCGVCSHSRLGPLFLPFSRSPLDLALSGF